MCVRAASSSVGARARLTAGVGGEESSSGPGRHCVAVEKGRLRAMGELMVGWSLSRSYVIVAS